MSDWLIDELNRRRWTKRELGQRAEISESMIYQVLRGERNAGFDFCVKVAQALDIRPELVLRRAGLLPDEPAERDQEDSLLSAFRLLPGYMRQAVIDLARNLGGITSEGVAEERVEYDARPPAGADALAEDLAQLTPEDQERVLDLLRRLRNPPAE